MHFTSPTATSAIFVQHSDLDFSAYFYINERITERCLDKTSPAKEDVLSCPDLTHKDLFWYFQHEYKILV